MAGQDGPGTARLCGLESWRCSLVFDVLFCSGEIIGDPYPLDAAAFGPEGLLGLQWNVRGERLAELTLEQFANDLAVGLGGQQRVNVILGRSSGVQMPSAADADNGDQSLN